jgi:ribosome-associated heat shock protein Hsp15
MRSVVMEATIFRTAPGSVNGYSRRAMSADQPPASDSASGAGDAAASSAAPARVRLDRWLWAARFFKTRSLAAAAVDGGRVDVNGERAKRARAIGAGDLVAIRRPPYEHVVVVRALAEQRGPASVAVGLYQETPESVKARELLRFQLRNAPVLTFTGGGRPTKRDRRDIEKMRARAKTRQ